MKLTRKQFLTRYTEYLMFELLKSMLTPEQAEGLSMKDAYKQFPRVSYFKHQQTGEIRVGLSFRGVRKLIKKHGMITVEDIRAYFNLGPAPDHA